MSESGTNFDMSRLRKRDYDMNNPLQAARFQRTVLDFMEIVRAPATRSRLTLDALNRFCTFVDDELVWHLAQTVVPEFRSALVEQTYDSSNQEHFANLNYVLRKLTRLPSPRSDTGVLDTERALLRQRHKMNVEYLVTGGKGHNRDITSDDLAEVERRVQDVQGVVDDVCGDEHDISEGLDPAEM